MADARSERPAGFLSLKNLMVANEILSWAKNWLMSELPELKRPAQQSDRVSLRGRSAEARCSLHDVSSGAGWGSEVTIEAIMTRHLDEFLLTPPLEPPLCMTKALLVVFPELPDERASILDRVHRKTKTEFVRAGLMASWPQTCLWP